MNLASRLKATLTPNQPRTVEENATFDDVVEYGSESVTITRDVAEKIGALNYGISLISETIASLPVYLYKRDKDGGRSRVDDYRNKLLNLENSDYSTAYNMKRNLVSDYLYHGNGYLDIYRDNDYKIKSLINKLLNLENSDYSTAYNMKRNLVSDYLYHGNGYLDIYRDNDYKIKSLIHIPYKDIQIRKSDRFNKREVTYTYDYWGMSNIPSFGVVNLARNTKDGELEGQGVLKEGSLILGNSYGFESFTETTIKSGFNVKGVVEKDGILTKPAKESLMAMLKKFFSGSRNAGKVLVLDDGKSGFNVKGVVEKDGILTKPAKESLMAMLKKFFSGSRNAGKVLVLDDGMKFKPISMSPADLELLQQKEFAIKDIARLLKIQPSLLGIANGGMTYSNEKDNQLQFLKYTIEPLLTIIEQTFNKYLLTEDEKSRGFFFEFNTQNMLRTSPADEIKMYVDAVKGTILTSDEARQRLNWEPLGLDKLIIPLSHGIVNPDGTITSHKLETNTSTEKNIEDLKGGDEDESGNSEQLN